MITAQVENGGSLNALISELRVEYFAGWDNDPPFDTYTLSGAYANGGFTVTLPGAPDAKLLQEMTNYGNSIVSNTNTKHFRFESIIGCDSNGSRVGYFKLHDDSTVKLVDYGDFEDREGTDYTVSYWYVDRDVTVNGRYEAQSYDLNLKKGWNIVFDSSAQPAGNGNYRMTAPPNVNLKWQFKRMTGE